MDHVLGLFSDSLVQMDQVGMFGFRSMVVMVNIHVERSYEGMIVEWIPIERQHLYAEQCKALAHRMHHG